MSASKGELATGTPTDPSNDHHYHCPQSSPSTYLGTGKRRRCEFEEATSHPEPSSKRRQLHSSPPFLPVDTCPDTGQIAEQLPSPEVTNSPWQQPSEFHSNPPVSQKPPTEPCGAVNPITEESWEGLEREAQDGQIRGWVLGTEGSADSNSQPPPIEPYPDPDPMALRGLPSVKLKPSQESLWPASSYGENPESVSSADTKSNFYSDPAFLTLLKQHGTYMDDSPSGLDKEELEFCRELLSTSAPHPPDSMLDEAVFLSFSKLSHNKSEQWLVKNMHPHLFPAPELLALREHDEFKGLGLIEGCDDIWLRSMFPSYGKCPQPHSTMAFKWENFSREELRKLGIIIGLRSKYTARDDMFFPFITREAKSDTQPLYIADRQNVYSMSIALDGVIDLFRRAGRLEDLNGKALGLSMSYDNDTVKMHAHYVVTNTQEPDSQPRQPLPKLGTIKYWTSIDHVSLSKDGGKDRWKPYDFFYNACLKFSQRHLKRVKEAIALLPDPAEAPSQSASSMHGLEQGMPLEEGVFKKPRTGGVSGELRRQLPGLERQLEEQRDDSKTLQDRLLQLLESKGK